jgi:biotin carboxylase
VSKAAGPALLIMSELKMIIRHLRLVEHAQELGHIPVLVFSLAPDSAELRALMADPDHPLSRLGGLHRVAEPSAAGVLAALPELADRYDIRGVLSCGEFYVEPAGMLAHVLGLPGTGWPAAAISRNKLLQRYALARWSPRWRAVPPAARACAHDQDWEWGGSLVVKPATRMSSSGVQRVRSPADLGVVLASYPANETLLVERCVSGPEFSVETLVQDGEPVWCGITRKETNEEGGRHFTELAHTVPADGLAPEEATELTSANLAVLRRLDFRDGVTHAEYRLTDGGPVLMEVACRIPGGGISALWRLATGASMEERLVDLALGTRIEYPRPRRRARHVFLDHPHGHLADVRCPGTVVSWTLRDHRWPPLDPVAADAAARSCAVLVSKLPGDELGALVDGDARSVSLIVDAPLSDDINELSRRARDGIAVVVR